MDTPIEPTVGTETTASVLPKTATPAPTGVAPVGAVASEFNGPFPAELHGWNWGAFFLNWIWGIAHNVWLALLVFIPFVGIVMPFVLGAKGNEWAWQHRKFENVEQFRAVQKAWAKWGVGIFIISIVLSILSAGAIAALIASSANVSTTTSPSLY